MNGKKLWQQLGLRYPCFQGGMARVATGAFAAAASNAGALGIIGSGSMEPSHLEEALAELHGKIEPGRPYGVNLMMMNPHVEEMIAILEKERVPVITTGAGNPAPVIDRLKAVGSLVIPVIASPLMAVRVARLDVDAIIAEGCEAGGHVGRLTTMSLLPQVVDAVDLPVIAAGGIVDGRQVAAAFALGAAGVQVGTLLLGASECAVHETFQKQVLRARAEDVITIGRCGGTPCQLMKNAMARQYLKMEQAGADWETLERFALGGLRKAVVEGDLKGGAFMMGQSVGLVKEVKTMAEHLAALFEHADEMVAELGLKWEDDSLANKRT